jgi:ribonuclease R
LTKPKKKQPSPLPTKEQVLAFIRESPVPVGKREIAKAFNVSGADRVGLKELLRGLRNEGAVARGTRRELMDPDALPEYLVIEVTGPDADGDLTARPVHWNPDDGSKPPAILVLPSREHAAPGTGERLLARLRATGPRRYEARIVRKVGSGPRRVLGVVETGLRNTVVRPTDRKLRFEIEIAAHDLNGAVAGDVVWIEPLGRRGRVLEKVGTLRDPGTISLIAIAANDIPVAFPDAALAQAHAAGPAPLGNRLDLRAVPFVTIDGEDARDFDDAVWAEADPDPANPGGWHLRVAIADVSWYVRPDDALDGAALRRGNSVYFPDRVVPMLPEELSNGWCSLRPREDRPTLAAEIWIDAQGRLLRHRFQRALIRSAARLTYTRVQQARDGHPDDETAPLLHDVIAPLYGAYDALLAARRARGTLDLDLPERLVSLGEDGRIASIRLREHFDSHRLIEEFMILANVAAAETLERRHQPCMYRIHAPPDAAKVQALREFLATLGIGLPPGLNLKPRTALRTAGPRNHPAQPEPGPVQPAERRPFRPGAQPLCALHLTDPALCRPAGSSRADHRPRSRRRRSAAGCRHHIRGDRRRYFPVRTSRRNGRARRHGPLHDGLYGRPAGRRVQWPHRRRDALRTVRRARRQRRQRPGADQDPGQRIFRP